MQSAATQLDLEPLLDESEYIAITRESRATAKRNRMLGRGCRYLKIGSRVRYDPADVREYLDRCRRGDGPA